jgi:hypothetical protein
VGKHNEYPFVVRSFSVTLASLKLLRLGNVQINLAFRSTFRNFAVENVLFSIICY